MPDFTSTLRTRPAHVSPMSTLPSGSTARLWGPLNSAARAGPPSPLAPALPVPARCVSTPVASILSSRFPEAISMMKRLPARSKSTPNGSFSLASAAGMPVASFAPPATRTILSARNGRTASSAATRINKREFIACDFLRDQACDGEGKCGAKLDAVRATPSLHGGGRSVGVKVETGGSAARFTCLSNQWRVSQRTCSTLSRAS